MLTLKLVDSRSRRTRILELPAVEVKNEGHVHVISGGEAEFRVGAGLEFDAAYVENSSGSTIHLIRNGEHRAR